MIALFEKASVEQESYLTTVTQVQALRRGVGVSTSSKSRTIQIKTRTVLSLIDTTGTINHGTNILMYRWHSFRVTC